MPNSFPKYSGNSFSIFAICWSIILTALSASSSVGAAKKIFASFKAFWVFS
ncbi:hypothetical protein PUW86_02665 [Metamycoplasma hyosynoviae]|uniref:hypothetical protein n=1 Tax=Metamycoplasma hyosynoviae TaxID=29559 RepID=UPI002366A679|nr:hypothetical protein [Metamycoplasma hyosynoviae]MDD7837880.1 hypothetical protein [Metamycoplasma hyosynoviae]